MELGYFTDFANTVFKPQQLFQAAAMGAAASSDYSDFVDPETLPLQILLASDNNTGLNGQNQLDKKNEEHDELEKLLQENWHLRHETAYWRDYARSLECSRTVSLKSPLTRWSEKMYRPDWEGADWQWYKTNCPCCRRPLEITMSSVHEKPWTRPGRGYRYAFVTALWGANAGYALGALVLGFRLRELSPEIERVIIHTDDVPSNYLEAFKKDGLWQLRTVDYIDGVSDLYVTKGNIFDGVFTKLAVWTLEEYEKVLLLDIDIIPLKPLDELFKLSCPAAMVRGQGTNIHGSEMDGRQFFGTEDNDQDYPWGQSGGINAGLILLQPDSYVFQQMLSEVTCKNHPCHVAGNGPEQDYLSRFFAAQKEHPWHHISVAWNYQLHQCLFAIERVLKWRGFLLEMKPQDFSEADKEWLPERLTLKLEDVGVVHFSGEVKMWHRILAATSSESEDRRREVSHALVATNGEDGGIDDVAFAERLMSYQRGHALWISKTAQPEDYQDHGCKCEGQKIFVGEKNITQDLDWMVQRVLDVAAHAAKVWRECYEKLQLGHPGLLDELQKPHVPEGCFDLGTDVEVSWTMGQGSRVSVRWFPATVMGVHDNKHYILRYDQRTRGDWGDTERNVHPERVRLPTVFDEGR